MENLNAKVDVVIDLLVEIITELEYKGDNTFEDKAEFSLKVRERTEKMIKIRMNKQK